MALKRLGVLGWPVSHSRSPAIHNAALAALGLEHRLRYQRLPVPPEAFAETTRALHTAGFAGANVTIPHKEAALGLATEATPAARAIGAANTLTFAEGAIRAHNTDAPGLMAALGEPAPRSALVLGAGGSARAAAYALRASGAEVAVWNRTSERARRLAADLGVEAVEGAVPAEALVNTTPAGLSDPDATFKDLPIDADQLDGYTCVVDLVYRNVRTVLLRQAERRGCRVIDGLEVLVRQGALSFEIWTGRCAPVDVMRRAARLDPGRRQPPTAKPESRQRGAGP